MRAFSLAATLAAALAAVPADAVVIDVAPGSACKATTAGGHLCRWLDASGAISHEADLFVQYRNQLGTNRPYYDPQPISPLSFFSMIVQARANRDGLRVLPTVGSVELELPFETNAFFDPPGLMRLNRLELRYSRGENVLFSGSLEITSELADAPATRKKFSETFSQVGRGAAYPGLGYVEVVPSSLWRGTASWSITEGPGLGVISADTYFSVPEPSTWAFTMLGFGALGAAIRRAKRAGTVMQGGGNKYAHN